MLVTPSTAQFWGVPNKHWKDPAWQRLSRAYLERIVSVLPGAEIKEFSSGLDIKYGDKYLPLKIMHGKTPELAETMRQAIRDIESYSRAEGSDI